VGVGERTEKPGEWGGGEGEETDGCTFIQGSQSLRNEMGVMDPHIPAAGPRGEFERKGEVNGHQQDPHPINDDGKSPESGDRVGALTHWYSHGLLEVRVADVCVEV